MTVDEAVAAIGARWAPRPEVPVDEVLERAAVRFDGAPEPVVRVVRAMWAVRLFVQTTAAGGPGGRPSWASRYVHDLADVDGALDELLAARAAA